jgi:hypothetical protein
MKALLVAAIVTLASGCDFHAGDYVQGSLARLDAPSEAPVGHPIRVSAHATFTQRYKNPTLNIHVPLDGTRTIAVEAVAEWQEPPMGLGVLAGLPFATEVDLEGSVSCDRTGTYTFTAGQLPPVTVQVGP